MVQHVPIPPPGFDALSPDEQIEYVQSLWDRIADHQEAPSIPEWHRQILSDRAESYRADPADVAPWDEARKQIEKTLDDLGR